eukprot:7571495-Prorocentrum_lima.AAC.1
MQWDVVNVIAFMADAIIDEHREIDNGDFLITLHAPMGMSEARAAETKDRFAEQLADTGELEVEVDKTLCTHCQLDSDVYFEISLKRRTPIAQA